MPSLNLIGTGSLALIGTGALQLAESATTLADEILADSPAVFWAFQESVDGSTASDSSGNSRPGTKNGSNGTLGAAGIFATYSWSKALSDDCYWSENGGSGGSNNAALDVGTGDYAYEFVCDLANGTGNYVEIASRDSGATGNGHLILLNISTGVVRSWCGGTALNGTVRISDGNPHHVVVTRESGTLKIYVDGTLDASVSATGGTDVASRPLRFGVTDGSYARPDGKFENFAYYTSSLSSTRVTAHYATL